MSAKERPKIVHPEPDPDRLADPELVAKLTRLHDDPWEIDDRNAILSLNPYWWAGLFAAEHNVIHDQDEGFFIYDPTVGTYGPESHYKVQTDIGRRILLASREAEVRDLRTKRGLPVVRAITELLRGLTDKREPFHHKTPLVALDNGVVTLAGGKPKFEAFSPRFHIRSKSSVPFEKSAKCPRFERDFLKPMLEEEEDRDLLVRQIGLMLLGQNPAHRMCILEGDSSAGKTSLANMVVALLGEDRCVQLRTEHLDSQFELDALRGRTLLLGNDVGSTFLNTVGAQTLKGLVSTDLYFPEAKNRRDRRPLRGPFNILIGTNTKLTYRAQGDAAAWRRRMTIFPCRKPEGRRRITNFEYVLLKEEGPGIVNLFLDGARRALRECDDAGDLDLTEAQVDRVERLILRSDPLETFITRCLVRDGEDDVTAPELHEAYAAFCHARSWPAGSEEDFFKKVGSAISDRFGISRSHSVSREVNGKAKQGNGWKNLRLIDEGWRVTA